MHRSNELECRRFATQNENGRFFWGFARYLAPPQAIDLRRFATAERVCLSKKHMLKTTAYHIPICNGGTCPWTHFGGRREKLVLIHGIIYHLGRESFPEQLVLHAHRHLPSR